ncbi:fructose-2,6-bisphosphatase [Solibacillus sp. FSL H8-0538]|uniref:fructose-2,6-bisphosphatase n=1 Tax=Solibacillus sp. FSL H8-0538 TaxID=2921400 RepID=UPI0030F9751D
MKKLIFSALLAVLLVGCGQGEEVDPNVSTEQGNASQEESTSNTEQQIPLTLFKSDANAEYVEPYDVIYTGEETELVRFIFEQTAEFNVGLLDYTFENNNTSLVLNLDDNIYNVQGSAGGAMFAGTLIQSYFANFTELNDVTFIHNGSYEEILDHLMVGKPYTRDDNNAAKPK